MNSKKKYILNIKYFKMLISMIRNQVVKESIILSFDKNRILKNGFLTNRFFVELSKEDVNILLDDIAFFLTSKGLDTNDEINDLGRICEELIDLFSK